MNRLKFISLVWILALAGTSLGQQNAKLFVSDGVEGYSGTTLKWVTSNLYSNTGYEVHRKIGSGSWEKISTEPVTLNKTIDTNSFSESADRGLYRALTSMDYSTFQENKMLKVFVVLQGIHSNQFAEAIGMFYHDSSAPKGQVVQYKLTENGKEIAVSEPYQTGSFSVVLPPDSALINRDKKGVHLVWKPNEMEHAGIWVYRKSDSDFEKINDMPARPRKLKNGKWAEAFYSDLKVEKELDYTYQLVARDYFGRESKPSANLLAPSLKQTDSPGAIITNIGTKASEMKITLEWQCEQSKDLKGFNVYEVAQQDTILRTSELLKSNTKSFEFNTENIGWKNAIVEAVFINTSKKSNPARVYLGDVIPPDDINGFTVSTDTGSFSFSWNKSNATDLKGYKIYRSIADKNNDDNSWTPITGNYFDSTTFTFELQDNVTQPFAFYVIATDTNYNFSKPSKVIVAGLPDIYPPQKPLIKAIDIVKKDSVELLQIMWLANADADLKGYNLYKRPKGDTLDFKQVNFKALPKSSLRYTDRLAKPGIRYEYKLQAEDTNGLKSELSSSFYGGLPEKAGDIKPVNVQVRSNSKKKQITVSWNEVPTKNLEGFTVYAGNSKDKLRPVTSLSKKTNNTFNVSTEGNYFVQVRAISTKGKVIKSDIQETTIIQKK